MRTKECIFGLMLIVITLPIYAQDKEDTELTDLLFQIKQLQREIGTLKMLQRIDLTKEQAEKIMPLAELAQQYILEFLMDEEILKEQKDAFTELKKEDLKNQGFSQKVEKRAAIADRKGKEAKEEFDIRIEEIADKIEKEILTESQRSKIKGHSVINNIIISPVVIPFLKNRFGIKSESEEALGSCLSCLALTKDIQQLRKEINILNLVNGLYMSQHQIAHLINTAEKMRPTKEEAQKIIKTLTDIRDCLLKRKEHPIGLLEDLRKTGYHKQREKMDALIEEIEGILSPEQKEVLLTYNKCLIPPKHLKDPVNVGQAQALHPDHEKLLKRIRKIPERIYEDMKEYIIEEMIARARKPGVRYSEEEMELCREQARKKLGGIFDAVRQMDDTEFELKKSEIEKEFKELKKELKKLLKPKHLASQDENEQEILKHNIRLNFLDPAIIPVLKERLKLMKEFNQGKPVDLDKISPAESCKDGKCAIKE